MPQALAWITEHLGRRLDNEHPTWSWLSVEAVIWCFPLQDVVGDKILLTTLKVIRLQQATTGGDMYAEQKHLLGLVCQAPIWRFTWRKSRGTREDTYHCNGRPMSHWHPDLELNPHLETFALQINCLRPKPQETGITSIDYLGLVVSPVDESRTQWARLGYYWFIEEVPKGSDHGSVSDMLGEIETITIV